MAANITPEYAAENVLVGQARLLLQPVIPGGPAAALPLDTVPMNGPWGVAWTAIGATDEGVTLAFSRTTENITIEEQSVPVDVTTTETNFAVNAALAEDTFKTMRIAFGGGTITTVAATPAAPGIQRLKISSELEQFALGLEGKNEFGFWRRILIPVTLSVADAEAQYRRAAAKRMWNVSFRSLTDIENCDIVDYIAAPTGP